MKKTTLVLASLAAISSCAALSSSNYTFADHYVPPAEIRIGNTCLYSYEGTYKYYDSSTDEMKTVTCGDTKGATYDKKTNTVTLDNFSSDGTFYSGYDNTTIVLKGENRVSLIYHEVDNLTITGDGSLTLSKIMGNIGPQLYGNLNILNTHLYLENGFIEALDVTIKNSDVRIFNQKVSTETEVLDENRMIKEGIYAGTVSIDNSYVSIAAEEEPIYTNSSFMASSQEDVSSEPIKISNAKLADEKHKIIIKEVPAGEHSMGTYLAVIGTDETIYQDNKFSNYPKEIEIIPDNLEYEGKISEKVDILEGADQEMNMKEIKDLVIRYNRDVDSFTKVAIDGNVVPKNQYTLESGSTILTIKADYVKNLKAGEHTVAAYFEGEEKPIETSLTLTIKSANTGAQEQETNFLAAFSLVTLPILAITIYSLLRIKNRIKNKVSF